MSKTFLEALTSVGKNLQSGIDKLKEKNVYEKKDYQGVCLVISTSNYSTQLMNQINFAKDLKCDVQLCVGLNLNNGFDLCVSNEQLETIINTINSNNLTVKMLKIHAQTADGRWDGGQVSNIDAFFSYANTAYPILASLCEKYNISIFAMLNEQGSIFGSDYTNKWKELISTIKTSCPSIKLSLAYEQTAIAEQYYYNVTQNKSYPYLQLDCISINVYPTVLRKTKNYGSGKSTYKYGLYQFDIFNPFVASSLVDGLLKINDQVPVIISETGCIKYDTKDEINNMYAINDPSIRTDTLGNDQLLYFEDVFEELNNLYNGIFIWSCESPFILQSQAFEYIKNIFNKGEK